MKIKFYWSTPQGDEWLNEVVEVEPTDAALFDAAEEYYDRTKEDADRLVSGWVANGAVDICLWPNGEAVVYNCPITTTLWRAFDSLHS